MVSLEDHDMVGKKVYWDLFEWKLVRSIIAYWNVRLNRESMDWGDPLSVSVSGFSRTCSGLEGAEICKSKYINEVDYVFGREIHHEIHSLNMYNQAEPPTSKELSPG